MDYLSEISDQYGTVLEAEQQKTFYRARRIHSGNIRNIIADGKVEGFDKGNSGAPPEGKAPSGRANPAGISMLYLASDIATACAEVRPIPTQLISVGSFKLKMNAPIIDLCVAQIKDSNKYSREKMYIALKKIMFEFARPQDEQTDIDYAVSQFITGFFKQKGFHGIKYLSSHNNSKGSYNLVLFDENLAECISEHGVIYRCISEQKKFQVFQTDINDGEKIIVSNIDTGELSNDVIDELSITIKRNKNRK